MRTHRRLSATVLVAVGVATAAALAGCSSAGSGTARAASALGPASPAVTPTTTAIPHWPVTVTAANGAVTIKGLPPRIVSLDPTATEDLYAVGAGTQVVAVDEDSDFPPGAPVTSLSGGKPDVGAIARYNPSLVISQNQAGLVQGLAKLGIPVLIEPEVSTLRDAYAQIEQIGLATGHGNQASEVVADMREEINDVVQQAGAKYRGMSYYWEAGAHPYRSVTSSTLIGHVMDLFGLRNIADTANATVSGNHPEVPADYLVAARPQIIFLADSAAADGGQTPGIVAGRPGWAAIPAVRDHQVFALSADIASRWGPRLPQFVGEIASALGSVKS
ncbi:MAG: helical backbone metal receptor [Trebonia sp.]|jgi:iron complex transport system substrate-binding protein